MMNTKDAKGQMRKQKGIALLLCVFALLLITGIALAMLGMSDTDTSISANYREAQKAYFSALGGVQEARVRLLTDATVLPSTMPSSLSPNGVVYIINPNNTAAAGAILPWDTSNTFYDDELCHESYPALATSFGDPNRTNPNQRCTTTPGASGWYQTRTSTDPNTGTAGALDYRWVRISYKENRSANPFNVADTTVATNNGVPICWDGMKQFPLPPGLGSCTDHSTNLFYENVFRIASLAVTRTNTRRMVLAEVAKTPPFMTNAAVDSQDHVTLNGQLTVNGFDYCSCDTGTNMSKCTATTVTVGGKDYTQYNCPSFPGKQCDNTKFAIYAAGSVDNPNKSETIVAGPVPPIAQNQPWNYDINGLIDMYKDQAVNVTGAPYNWTCTAATSTSNGNCGTVSASSSTGLFGIPPAFPPSPVSAPVGGTLGTPTPQITYIPGNAQLTGGWNGNGILIVDGDLNISGGLQYYGLILVRGVIKFTGGGSDSTNIYGAVMAGQESYVDNTLGGSAVINFNACALQQNQTPMPPRVISIRDSAY